MNRYARLSKFGAGFAQRAKAVRRKPGSTWHLDGMFMTLCGEPYLLWRAVDEHGAELDVLVQKRRDKAAARAHVGEPEQHLVGRLEKQAAPQTSR
jgi:transposase-like protein